MLRTRAAVASTLLLACATWCLALVASSSGAAAPPLTSAPTTTTSTSAAVTTSTTTPPTPATIYVPSLIGLSLDELPRVLLKAGLKLGNVTGTGATVTAQNPAANSPLAAPVPIDVTLGVLTTTPRFVVVPNLSGFSVARARRAVLDRGLRFFTSARTGYVSSQDPQARETVVLGTMVSVAVGSHAVVRYVQVPDVRGDSLGSARKALSDVGLTLSGPAGSGTVASQRPSPDQTVRVGSSVSVTIAVIAAPTSARPRSNYLYWVIGAVGVAVLAVAGAFAAHHREPGHRDDADPPVPPAPHVTSRLIADTVRTTRGRPTGPTVELRTREHASLKMERIP